ncbi:TetR/AcrR family transcriptional regulator [Shimia abyssi]|uniref:TetR family transcriptional regulator n=1 Tax=Shimia abyssi TaxID=1662395 RepID=A0A2P8FCZ6_9RHOB|nr:TetR/AcrR family transcriptional regulator [Shimia abyssi]PSL19585.1 TetR family transcriptional regulator [Shimia abyssi]
MKGRPRTFDEGQVLSRITDVFWRKGYVGTTMSDLVEATGLTKPSLYAAYGNKASMYSASLDRYIEQQSQTAYVHLKRDDIGATKAIRMFLKASLASVKHPDGPKGCLVLSSSTDDCGGHLPNHETAKVHAMNALAQQTYVAFFERALLSAGRPTSDAQALGTYLMTLHTGLRQMTTRGVSKADLEDVVEFSVGCIAQQLDSCCDQ